MVCQDYEGGEVYPFSSWTEEPEWCESFSSLNDAWWSACIDSFMKPFGDIRLHPLYSYKLKAIAE